MAQGSTAERAKSEFVAQFGRTWRVLLVVAILLGCVAGAPPLSVVVESPATADRLWVRVKPVVTDLFSEDRRKFGMDLSAHYTTLEVQIRNQTSQAVRFDPAKVTLTDRRGKSYAPLDEKESVEYYMTGGQRSVWRLFPGASARKERETQTIVIHRMVGGELPSGETGGGLLYFKRIHPKYCGEMTLVLPFTVVGTGEAKTVTFRLSCTP